MRVGIVTYAHCANYGAELQACALSRIVKRILGDEAQVETLWFDRSPVTSSEKWRMIRRAFLGRLRRHPLGGFREIFTILLIRFQGGRQLGAAERELVHRRDSAFEKFWNECEPHSRRMEWKGVGLEDYDILIAGSDQIWNWRLTGDMSPFFLLFDPPSRAIRKISYAASVSVDEIDECYRAIYKKGLENLDCISVRETHGAKLLSDLTDKTIEVVLDPTLLITANEWSDIADDRIAVGEPYVLVYTLNSSARFFDRVMNYAGRKGMRVVNIFGGRMVDARYDVTTVYDAGPREFLHLVRNASVVITNSFHGTIFAINFKVPFISVLNPASSVNSRILSITGLVGLDKRVVYDDEQESFESLPDIDYAAVHDKLDVLRQKSLDYLRRGLDA